jgi:hypothetical protein
VAVDESADDVTVVVAEQASVETVTLASDATVQVAGSVGTITVSESAPETKIDVSEGGTVETVKSETESVTISGAGTVTNTVIGEETVSAGGQVGSADEENTGTSTGTNTGTNTGTTTGTTTGTVIPSVGTDDDDEDDDTAGTVTTNQHNCVMTEEQAAKQCVTTFQYYCTDDDGVYRTNTPTGHVWSGNICSVCGTNKDDATKFELTVASGAAVTATVYDDYSLEVVLPATERDTVYTNSVTIDMMMQNVSSLGVTGTPRTYTKTVSTGLGTIGVDLYDWLENCYNFTDGTMTINIETESCTYRFAGDGLVITGTPTDIEATRAAWQELTDHVDTTGKKDDNSYITIANGSYLHVGPEKLSFDSNYKDDYGNAKDLVLDNFDKLSDMKDEILAAVVLDKSVSNANDITAVLKDGTTLAVSSSWAKLVDDATITVNGFRSEETQYINGMLSALQTAAHDGTKETIQALVEWFDCIVYSVDQSDGVTVTIDFGTVS